MLVQTQRIPKDEITSETAVSFDDFESMFGRGQLNITDQNLRKSYQSLHQLQKHKKLSRRTIEKKLHTLGNELQTELLKSGGLKAPEMPLTETDWDRI